MIWWENKKRVLYLEMRAAKTARNLLEKRFHDFSEMLGFDHVEDLFEFIEEHDFLETACFGPELEQT